MSFASSSPEKILKELLASESVSSPEMRLSDELERLKGSLLSLLDELLGANLLGRSAEGFMIEEAGVVDADTVRKGEYILEEKDDILFGDNEEKFASDDEDDEILRRGTSGDERVGESGVGGIVGRLSLG